MIYYAKSKLANGKHPTVKEHLESVALLAGQYGEALGCFKEAALAGQLHDFGKYSKSFQDVLNGMDSRIDHAFSSAALLYALKANTAEFSSVIEAISGHHNGLRSYEYLKDDLVKSIKGGQIESVDGKFPSLNGEQEYGEALKQFIKDFPNYKLPILRSPSPQAFSKIQAMLYTRMLFSCLVDADYSASAQDEDESYLHTSAIDSFDPEETLKSLYRYKAEIVCSKTNADVSLNKLRDSLFKLCGDMGEACLEGAFTLTAPTGTGKTLALLHFALRHFIRHNKKRIIIVLPFLSLTEQSAAIYREIYPMVLEDHSQSQLSDEFRDFSARWSVPIIVTTSVRFFESLFADRPTDCRKLHNIANSVVVFDEAQSLPVELTRSTLQTVDELCRRYHTTMLFSTATQPAYDVLPKLDWKTTEIAENNAQMFDALRRVDVEWRLSSATPLKKIAEEMAALSSVCVIVNLKSHAQKLYNQLKELTPEDELFLISTDLCSAHRSKVIEEVRQRLESGLPCRVVATQCIEAGVDFDFDVLYRALAPLEAIVQAAGRCNRNGRLPGKGKVVVFLPDEAALYPEKWYGHAANITAFLVHKNRTDIYAPAVMREYYELLFADAKEKASLTKAIETKDYAKTAEAYRLIDKQSLRVIVPYFPGATKEQSHERYRAFCSSAIKEGLSPALMKSTAPFVVEVSVWKKAQLEDIAEPLPYSKRRANDSNESGYYLLRPQYEDCYSTKTGFVLPTDFEENFSANII